MVQLRQLYTFSNTLFTYAVVYYASDISRTRIVNFNIYESRQFVYGQLSPYSHAAGKTYLPAL